MSNFVVMSSPFVHSGNDVNKMFLYTSVALVVPAVYGIIFFGIEAMLLILASLASCMLSEMLFNFINGKKFKVDNFSFFVTGMILALTLPVKTPIWVLALSAFFSIFVIKQAFGGLGFNKFNPANCGRCLAGVIVPALSSSLYSFTLNGDTYESLATGGVNNITDLLSGQAVGGIGTTCILLIVVCAIILTYTRVIDIMNELGEYGIVPVVADPVADAEEGKQHYGIEFVDINTVKDMDAVIIAVGHTEFMNFSMSDIDSMFANGDNSGKVIVDVKGVLNRKDYSEAGYQYWRL